LGKDNKDQEDLSLMYRQLHELLQSEQWGIFEQFLEYLKVERLVDFVGMDIKNGDGPVWELRGRVLELNQLLKLKASVERRVESMDKLNALLTEQHQEE